MSDRLHYQRKQQCGKFGENDEASNRQRSDANFPISLGKPSLRRRLEAYYSLIAPDVIANESEWRKKFELIYDKYGGSEEGEKTLSRKLMKKYGQVVRLRLATQSSSTSTPSQKKVQTGADIRDEEWYKLTLPQQNSGIVDFTSERFDPAAVIAAPTSQIIQVNPFVQNAPLVDNISQFQSYLPPCDPLYREPRIKKVDGSETGNKSSTAMKKKIPVFTSMAAQYEKSGPLSLLHSIHVQRERIKVSIRYVDCMRGTLTGYLLAFDKHMNMILRDVDEVYTSRVTMVCDNGRRTKVQEETNGRTPAEEMVWTKPELEWMRRKAIERSNINSKRLRRKEHLLADSDSDLASGIDHIKVGKRHMHQILVRGDNVVSVHRANDERYKGGFNG